MTAKQIRKPDQVQAAKELLADEEKKQGDIATQILKKAIDDIDKLGFSVVPCGTFNGNAMSASIKIFKKHATNN